MSIKQNNKSKLFLARVIKSTIARMYFVRVFLLLVIGVNGYATTVNKAEQYLLDGDEKAAVKLLTRLASEANHSQAMLTLARLYNESKELRDEKLSFKFAKNAVEMGNLDAYYLLSQYYRKGVGVASVPKKANELLEYCTAAANTLCNYQYAMQQLEKSDSTSQVNGYAHLIINDQLWSNKPENIAAIEQGKVLKEKWRKKIKKSRLKEAEKLAQELMSKYHAHELEHLARYRESMINSGELNALPLFNYNWQTWVAESECQNAMPQLASHQSSPTHIANTQCQCQYQFEYGQKSSGFFDALTGNTKYPRTNLSASSWLAQCKKERRHEVRAQPLTNARYNSLMKPDMSEKWNEYMSAKLMRKLGKNNRASQPLTLKQFKQDILKPECETYVNSVLKPYSDGFWDSFTLQAPVYPGVLFISDKEILANLKNQSVSKSTLTKRCLTALSNRYIHVFDEVEDTYQKFALKQKQKQQAIAQQEKERLRQLKLEKERQQKKQAENIARLDNIEQQVAQSVNGTVFAWSANGEKRKHYFASPLENQIALKQAYLKYIGAIERKQYTPSSKGEFEKQSAFEQRVKQDRLLFKQKQDQQFADASNNSGEFLTSQITKLLGDPRMSRLKYNADKEVFTFIVKSALYDEPIKASLAIPIKMAKSIKPVLQSSTPKVYYSLLEQTLFPFSVVLRSENVIYPATIDNAASLAIVLTEKTFNDNQRALNKKVAYEKKKQQQAKANKAKSFPYYAVITCNYGALRMCLGKDGLVTYRTTNHSGEISAYSHTQEHSVDIDLTAKFSIGVLNGKNRAAQTTVSIYSTASDKLLNSQVISGAYSERVLTN